jgi:hypothetical protein
MHAIWFQPFSETVFAGQAEIHGFEQMGQGLKE